MCFFNIFSHSKFDAAAAVVLHIHGGGWVAQTPETHITYLREWARQLTVPVFSVNYTYVFLELFHLSDT